MSEADLLAQLTSFGNLLWGLMQYWTSVSIGILIGSHFCGKETPRRIARAVSINLYDLYGAARHSHAASGKKHCGHRCGPEEHIRKRRCAKSHRANISGAFPCRQ